MKKSYNILLVLLFVFASAGCDSKKHFLPVENFLCYTQDLCEQSPRGTHFAMLGDSWTDLIGGATGIWTFRTYFEKKYGFRVNGATQAGQTLDNVVKEGIHRRVIENSGADLSYVIVSLGGNDMLYEFPAYGANLQNDKDLLFYHIKQRILLLVRTGNLYKKEIYGGKDLVWFFHGYDYLNPDNPIAVPGDVKEYYIQGCRDDLLKLGYPTNLIVSELVSDLDRLNAVIKEASFEEPSIRYVDVRGTLGGPAVSKADLMFDCIHPNSEGFALLSARFVAQMDLVTGGAR